MVGDANHYHSPLEGESANQGRSPRVSRWGEWERTYQPFADNKHLEVTSKT